MNFLRGALLATLMAAVAGGCSEKKRVGALDFAAYGDCRHQPKMHRQIVTTISAANPKFVLVSGDLVDHGDEESEWLECRDILKDLRARSKYYCCVGDHDDGPHDYFLREMGTTKWYHDAVEGDFHIFVLDCRSAFAEKEQMEWLEKTALASTAKHKIAVFHRPPFMIDRDQRHKDQAQAIYKVRLKFCAAICGHQHGFYTTLRDGVRYVVTAGGGAPLWKIDPSLGQAGDKSRAFFHFVGFKIAGPRIEAHVYDPSGVEAEDLAFTLCEHP